MRSPFVKARSGAWMLLASFLCLGALPVSAQTYPNKPIRLVVPFPPGGTTDLVARAVTRRMQERLGQPIIVDNKAGGGSVIGTDVVSRAAPDGYTLLWTATPLAINATLFNRLPYDTVKSFAPVGTVGGVPLVLIVPGSAGTDSVSKLLQAAKAKPGELTYGSSGPGGSTHLAGAMFASRTGINITHVPYKGSAPAVQDLLAGVTSFVFDTVYLTRPFIESGKARALAQTGRKRSSQLPNVPTMAEAGITDFEVESWHVLLAPAGTPRPVVDRLNAELNAALANPEVKSVLTEQGLEIRTGTPDQAGQFLRSEIERWGKVVTSSGATAE